MNEASIIGLLEATVSFGALLYLAALGEMITEKAGILNLGVEGMMAMGAVTGFVVALHTGIPGWPWLGRWPPARPWPSYTACSPW